MKVLYKALIYSSGVDTVEVERESESQIWIVLAILVIQCLIRRERVPYYPSFEEAKRFLIEHAQTALEAAEKQVEYARTKLEQVKRIQEG